MADHPPRSLLAAITHSRMLHPRVCETPTSSLPPPGWEGGPQGGQRSARPAAPLTPFTLSGVGGRGRSFHGEAMVVDLPGPRPCAMIVASD
jgi:hypothetical protein